MMMSPGASAMVCESIAKKGEPAKGRRRVETQNNSGFQKAHEAVGLVKLRVHGLHHTFGQRLSDAGVSEEDRALLMGQAGQNMHQHYAAAMVARLPEAANSLLQTRDRMMVRQNAD